VDEHPVNFRRLVTERLVLVPQTRAAARAIVAGVDPGFPLGEGYPHADTLDGLRLAAEHGGDGEGDGPSGGWFIALAEGGTVIGDCGTKGGIDDRGQVEIGYGLAGPFRGRGYGGEAVGALVGWLRARPEVTAVTAEVEVGNMASRRLLERLGFKVQTTVDGSWWLVLPA
jgi:RimJ/RimL family protein N-acetyltransferase